MPPTISVTVGMLDTLLAAFDPVAVELLDPLELQAARPAVSAAALAIVVRMCLDIAAAPWVLDADIYAMPGSFCDFGRQDSSRRSSRLIRPSAVSVMTAMMNIAPNTPSGLKLFCELAITR